MACSVSGAAPHRMFHHATAPPREMTTTSAPPPLEASDFDWIGDLGRGGFATVIKVRHRRTGEVFALKEAIHPTPDAYEEAEVLLRAAASPSPYVVRCHAVIVGPHGGPASVLEYMDGGSLYAVLRWRGRGRGFPEPALAEVAARCLMGLLHLHSRGVAHLDVKPDNFLVNSQGEVKINDFNTSRIVYDSVSEGFLVPTTMGTTCYFSPERFEPDAHAEPRGAMAADVWGLGLTVLELFLGRSPVVPDVEEPTHDDWKEEICDRGPPTVPEYVEASPELEDFVDACLHKDPTRRATVTQLLRHPFVTRRDVAASSRALRELILESL
jgi:mitogen-activated protein kinase kinase 9